MRIDTNKIIDLTNEKIAYSIYEREEKMKKNSLKKIAYIFVAGVFLIGGTISVDAMTDNSISKAIKDALTVKIDNDDYNAKCDKLDDGTINCEIASKDKDGPTTSFTYQGEITEDIKFGAAVNEDKYEATIKNQSNNK